MGRRRAGPADRLHAVLRAVAGARTFEEAAARTIDAIVAVVEGGISAHDGSRVVSSIVHVRPGAEYSRVFSASQGGREDGTAYEPSARTWRWIEAHLSPVVIDVRTGAVDVVRDGAIETIAAVVDHGDAWETRQGWLERDTTHVLGLPLITAGGDCCGMVTVEAHAPNAVGESARLLPVELIETASALAMAVTPYQLSLPVEQERQPERDALLPVIGPSMRATVRTLRVFAAQDETLLLVGPTGAGKSQLARWVHAQSPRASAPFEVVHLATRPEGLRLAELFGWRRGAFTGAVGEYAGALRRAQRGTLFLDEIDKLSLEDQAGLLRVLEERRFRPLGEAAAELHADVRFVLGTNADLRARVRAGTFREDLYYRIHVLPIRIPPLSERRDEIASWAQHMLERRHRAVQPGGEAVLERDAAEVLESRAWPGNLRQLDNVVRRAHALALSEHAEVPRRLTLTARQTERALAFEGDAGARPLLDVLHSAASAFVLEAEQREGEGGLDLDLADALRGLVIAVAAQKKGSVEAAFRLVGRASMVQHRNHAKAFRKEVSRLDALYRALTGEPSPYGTLLAKGDDRTGTARDDDAEKEREEEC